VRLSAHVHLVHKFRVSGVIPLFPIRLNGVHRKNFTVSNSTFNTGPNIYRSATKQNSEYTDTPETDYRVTNGVLFEIQHRLRRRLTHSSPEEKRKLTSHSDCCTVEKRGRVNHTAGELAPGVDAAATKFLPIPEI